MLLGGGYTKQEAEVDSDEGAQQGDVVKLRGLPWTASQDDIIEFFKGVRISAGREGIHLVMTNGNKPSGEAFVEPAEDEDIENFLSKDRKSMGHRYIEVYKVKRKEMCWYLNRNRPSFQEGASGGSRLETADCDTFVRLRGLPFECTNEDIQQFFQGLEISDCQLMVDNSGRSSGEAYVQFASKEQAGMALQQDRKSIGHRYIEVFRVGPSEMRSIQSLVSRPSGGGGGGRSYNSRPSPYDRGSRGGGDRRGGGRYGSDGGGRSRYYNKGFEEDWQFSGSGGNSGWGNRGPPPPPPRPRNQGPNLSSLGGGGDRNCVLMRGLPFRAEEDDIRKFFEPLVPTEVDIIFESSGRPSGTAKVQFSNGDDVTRAMGKHKEKMEHRYIELFLHNK